MLYFAMLIYVISPLHVPRMSIFLFVGFLLMTAENLFTNIFVLQNQFEPLGQLNTYPMLLAGGFALIGAPFFEEMLFRDLLQRRTLADRIFAPLQNERLRAWMAIIISAIVFSAGHHLGASETFTTSIFVSRIVSGAIFGYVFFRTSNLTGAISLHILHNLISLSFV